MTPKEKAFELFNEMYTCYQGHIDKYTAKQCVLIAVGEIIEAIDWHYYETPNNEIQYWQEVKQEIEKL